jgi:hypothetical protein
LEGVRYFVGDGRRVGARQWRVKFMSPVGFTLDVWRELRRAARAGARLRRRAGRLDAPSPRQPEWLVSTHCRHSSGSIECRQSTLSRHSVCDGDSQWGTRITFDASSNLGGDLENDDASK